MLISLLRASFSPFAARTQQYVKEQLGQADDKVRQYTNLFARMLICELSSIDPASSRLHRTGKEGRCLEAGSPEDATGYVSTSQIVRSAIRLYKLTRVTLSSQYSSEAYDYPNNIKEVR